MTQLLPRKLGRTETLVPPVLWRTENDSASLEVLRAAEEVGANWLVIPSDTSVEALPALATGAANFSLVIGVDMESLRQRIVVAFEEKLTALGVKRCAAILVENPSSMGVKSGWPFHRLGQLRDRGATGQFWIDAPDAEVAEWLVDNTPAHAVVVPFSEREQTARYRLLKAGADMGVAIIGGASTDDSETDVALRAAETGLTSQVVQLPRDLVEFERVINAIRAPLSAVERETSWERFTQRVPEPAKPKGAHPPEFGS